MGERKSKRYCLVCNILLLLLFLPLIPLCLASDTLTALVRGFILMAHTSFDAISEFINKDCE